AATGAAERTVDRGHPAGGDPAATGDGGDRVHGRPLVGPGVGPAGGGGAAGVDRQHGQVAVGVERGDPALQGPAVGEGHLGGAVPQVVGVGDDEAVGDDDAAAAAAVAADADDGGSDGLGHPADDRLLLRHGGLLLASPGAPACRRTGRGCHLQSASDCTLTTCRSPPVATPRRSHRAHRPAPDPPTGRWPAPPRSSATGGRCWWSPACWPVLAGSASCSPRSTASPPTSSPGGSPASRPTGSSSASPTRPGPSGTSTGSPRAGRSWPAPSACWRGGPRPTTFRPRRGPTVRRLTAPAARRSRRGGSAPPATWRSTTRPRRTGPPATTSCGCDPRLDATAPDAL